MIFEKVSINQKFVSGCVVAWLSGWVEDFIGRRVWKVDFASPTGFTKVGEN